jgi:antitoxin (DNA-binding transcriptional repressor) of toxin-antitoxin stability system
MMISKWKLKAKMLEYFREVERTGEPLIVTDHGRSVLEIRPLPQSGGFSRRWELNGWPASPRAHAAPGASPLPA